VEDLHERLDQRMLVPILEHEETNRQFRRGEHEDRVDHRSVIGHEQRTAVLRDVLGPLHVHPVDRVRGEPEEQAQEGVRHQHERVDRRDEREDRRPEEELGRCDVEVMRAARVDGGGHADPHERQERREGDDAPLLFLERSMLDQRVDRDDEESAGEPECRQQPEHRLEAQSVNRQGQAGGAHADGPQGNQAVLDLPAGQRACGVASDADSDRQRRLEVTAVRLVDVKDFRPVEDDDELEQRPEKPEVRVPGDGEEQNPIGPDEAPLLEELAKHVQPESSRRVGRGNLRDAETRRQSRERAAGEDQARRRLVAVEPLGEDRPADRARDDRRERSQLQHAVSPRQALRREKLGQQPVLRGTEQRGLRAREEDGGEREGDGVPRERQRREQHDAQLEHLRGDGHLALAEPVGEEPARHREQDEWGREQETDQQDP